MNTTTIFDALADLPVSDSELRKVAWVAIATDAVHHCRIPDEADAARERLAAVDTALREAFPEGGSVLRQFERVRAGCAG
jgi:hypothetical protein